MLVNLVQSLRVTHNGSILHSFSNELRDRIALLAALWHHRLRCRSCVCSSCGSGWDAASLNSSVLNFSVPSLVRACSGVRIAGGEANNWALSEAVLSLSSLAAEYGVF